ncbi:ABC transporter permease [Azospirillum brasilense]|uniref:ABC transporter permease n=2 Tax=Azospirillum TaxID=191 RepID=A0A0P0EGK5_AZOBR|nr:MULTISPECIES: ABC transporter permease [Azospirillum]ALJ38190.1 ABC transporter permease [Azospirillum brasilense]MBY3755943.1 ABC transporter permease [Azospirillum formosense]MDW7556091.1 ABC transporter permease [Azospirillum brasilense]MDW7596061.1 ABC transporter permease [Azospirillum brasilense]MDW7631061.1 ABC transporter permease [Azospirillum brasilense]
MPRIALFISQRLVKAVFVILAIAVFNFFLVHAAPGDPAAVMAGEAGAADAKFVEQLRQQFGLDRPLYEQLGTYMSKVVQADLGYSYRQQRPVFDLLMDRLPVTLSLTLTAFVLALLGGIALGTLAAMRAGTWSDTAITVVGLTAYATPIFWIGLMLILLFSVNLGWLPAFGTESIGAGYTGWEAFLDKAKHLVLPVTTLGLFYMAVYTRLTRASILEVRDMDFVKTARAKGLPEWRIVSVHILRNAILPVITVAGFQAGHLIGGSILIETVFALPGIGRLAFEAVLQRDYQVLLGIFLLTSVVVVVFNLLTDLIYSLVDPRIEVAP